MSILKSFDNAYKDCIRKDWVYMYVFVDLHSTIIKPNYKAGEIPTEFYDGALEGLKLLNAAKDAKIIMYTCSHPHEIEEYERLFARHGIRFDFINENPEVKTTPQGYGCYDMKPYFNVLLDDKAGFNAELDWEVVVPYLLKRYYNDLRTSQEWFLETHKKAGWVIYDYDGWVSEGSFSRELVTFQEYESRIKVSTCIHNPVKREYGN